MPTRTVIWAAGVVASELAGMLATAAGAQLDRAGRVAVGPGLTVHGRDEVIALGDMVSVHDGEAALALPGLATVAMQQGRYAARSVRARLRGEQRPPFRYVDKGNLATIGRARAVADIKGVQLSGILAWMTWLAVHIFYLIGFQNRVLVLTRWAVELCHPRAERSTHHRDEANPACKRTGRVGPGECAGGDASRRSRSMTYVISEPCIDVKDRSCVDVCPVDCIHEVARMLVIDPEECIDCGACEPECPVEAITPEDAVPDRWTAFIRINYAYPDGVHEVDALVQQQMDDSPPPPIAGYRE